ncbi:hypothetical protein ABEG18_00030 [Alsobacter sp. KACC 23698]|uniref:Core-binding (CB) domain-containing protein n=1 Tax=Alsobacter sp. KACC 23698 TaxID=3149229 RepID=A0AAU7JFM7_9HYPH
MGTINPRNERAMRRYLQWLREANQRSQASANAAAQAVLQFEKYTGCRGFGRFQREQAVGFKRELQERTSAMTGKPLSVASIASTLAGVKAFFTWLANEHGYRSKLTYADVAYFKLGCSRRAYRGDS